MEYFVYTDGGANGNPGPAGIGAVIYNEKQEEIDTISEFIGESTNNKAEYWALIRALENLKKRKAEKIHLRLDSELIVKQILGEYKVKNEDLQILKKKVDKLLEYFDFWEIKHVRREFNKRADELSRLKRE